MDKNVLKAVKIIAVIIVAILAFVIYWVATEENRYAKQEMREIRTELARYREEEDYFEIVFNDELLENSKFQKFLVTQVQEMYENKEFKLLKAFLWDIECGGFYDSTVHSEILLTAVTDGFANLEIEDAIKVYDELHTVPYYGSQIILNRDSEVIKAYIEKNGIQPITITPGEGYYANEKNSSTERRYGIAGSALYDRQSVTYMGDFECIINSGVDLNSNYEESSYSYREYYFRGHRLFDIDTVTAKVSSLKYGDWIWSGEYLFWFSPNGELLYLENLKS